MTNEEIKQNAKEIAKEAIVRKNGWHTPDDILFEDVYIAGAHSRDEEIKRLYNSLEHFRSIINNLRNPWISVEDRLPERINKFYSEPVLCRSYINGKEHYCITKYDYDFEEWQESCVTNWMPIPELKKGE